MNPSEEKCITLSNFHEWVEVAAYYVYTDSAAPSDPVANYYTGEDQIKARLKAEGIKVI